MCGICGILNFEPSHPVDEAVLRRMTRVLAHRGPDDEGIWCQGNVGLGHRRLAIIDLSPQGHQPMGSEDGAVWITYNGEVYNFRDLAHGLEARGHRFRSQTDTEVILHAYEDKGLKCLDRLVGMFAFGLWDARRRALLLVRDRVGKKPLYYWAGRRGLVFASEIKALLLHPDVPRRLNLRALSHFLSLNYVPGPETMFEGIAALPPGHYLVADQNGVRVEQYWDVEYREPEAARPCAAYVQEFANRLRDAVDRRLISDVPLGAFLSGGIDSSAVVALMDPAARAGRNTFSVGFREASFDESGRARRLARLLGTAHHTMECGPAACADLLPRLVWHADNCLADPSLLPLYQLSALARMRVTVALSGDGGDELLAGYQTYLADRLAAWYRRLPAALRRGALDPLARRLPVSHQKLSLSYRARKFVEGAGHPPAVAHYWWRTIFTEAEKAHLLVPDLHGAALAEPTAARYVRFYDAAPGADESALNRALYSDLKVWLPDSILAKVDTMSMAHGLEVRAPFLDHRLVEFCAALPVGLKRSALRGKVILREAMRGRLPREVTHRRKAGFNVPLSAWLRGPLRALARDLIAGPHGLGSGLFVPAEIDRLWEEHLTGMADHGLKLWGLMVFAQWSASHLAAQDEGYARAAAAA